MSDTLEQAKWMLNVAIGAWSNNFDAHIGAADKELDDAIDALIAAVRAEAQREAFEVGFNKGQVSASDETPDHAFAAYLKGQP